jgi:hypothetical protein
MQRAFGQVGITYIDIIISRGWHVIIHVTLREVGGRDGSTFWDRRHGGWRCGGGILQRLTCFFLHFPFIFSFFHCFLMIDVEI